jgi:hypothetical protein
MPSGPPPSDRDGLTGRPEQPGPEVEVVAASELDFEAYAEFQRAAFRDLVARAGASDSHMTPGFYRWKYHPPAGPARIARITAGDTVLSSSAMLPVHVTSNGKTVVGWHCVDVATVPEARRRGFLLATLRTLRASVSAEDLLFAFPNGASIGSFRRLGFRERGVVTTWVNPWVWASARRHPRIEAIERFGPEPDLVASSVGASAPFVARGPEYLDWRYSDHPNTRYISFVYRDSDGSGVCVVRQACVMNRELTLVMELHGSNPGIRTALLRHAARWGLADGRTMMVVMDTGMTPGIALTSMLAPVPSVLLPKRQVLVVAGSDPSHELPTRRWLVQTGDWDVF